MSTTPTPTALPPISLPSTFELPWRTVSAPDSDASQIQSYATASAQQVATILRIGAICDAPSSGLWVRVYFLDSAGNPLTVEVASFTSSVAPGDWGGSYVGIPNGLYAWWLAGAKAIAVKVDRITGAGTWTLTGSMA